ncbi:MAG: gliding motility-associated C-terminal domain-containing protein [Bacteroidota bacterium]|nr:gliding motility-associated C-terminal domain-containing protein [Bacteroidota bacterium]
MINWILSSAFSLLLWFSIWNPLHFFVPERSEDGARSLCTLTVDAGPDTNVCFPGGNLTLMGSVNGNAVFTQWSPATGLSNISILNPVANVTFPITYTLTGWSVDPNAPSLIVNGDFEAGNTGFTSSYTYVADLPVVQTELQPAGTYTVVSNPNFVHGSFAGCADHTPSGVNMMVINGAPSLQDIWCQTIAISPNTWYNVAAFAASVHSLSPAILRFSINGSQIGSTVNVPSGTCQWVPFNASWFSGSQSSATICVVNLNTVSNGNDFALDDIAVRELCYSEDEVTITLLQEDITVPEIQGPDIVCAGDIAEYSADFAADPEIFSYQWELYSAGTILTGQGTPQITVEWEDAEEVSLCLTIETRCEEAIGCLTVLVNDIPDVPFIQGPSDLCPNEIVTLYTPEIDPDVSYEWILPPQVTLISGAGTNEIEIEWAAPGDAEVCLVVTNDCGEHDNCFALSLYPEFLTLFDTVLCSGTTIDINGNSYGNGLWTGVEYFLSVHGCDSIVEIDITESDTLTFLVTYLLCPGDSVFLAEVFQSQAGLFTEGFTTVSGCDSVVISEIVLLQPDTTWIVNTTCIFNDAGTTIETLTGMICDSTVITDLVYTPPDSITILLYSCSPQDTGKVTQIFTNQAGCDSIILTLTTLLPTDTTLFFQSTCDPSGVGVFTDQFMNTSGCDSVVISTWYYLASDTTLLVTRVCTYTDTGTTSTLLVNSLGCDSLVIEHDIYSGSDTTYLVGQTCSAMDSGFILTPLLNQFGCDSIVSLYNSFNFSDTTYVQQSSCESADTGVVVEPLINMGGCDSLVITTTSLDPPGLCIIKATFTLSQPVCFGDIPALNIFIEEGLGPFDFSLFNVDTIIQLQYPVLGSYSLSFVGTGMYTINLTSANGLSVMQDIIVLAPAPLLIDAKLVSTYNGIGVPCFGDESGSLIVDVLSSGTPPLSYLWSTGDISPAIDSLAANTYSVTVSDTYGCFTTDMITITEPEELGLEGSIADILCFGETGALTISEISGGITPYLTSIDGNSFQTALVYAGLSNGLHQLVVQDQNGCQVETSFSLDSPSAWQVSIGPDTVVPFGSTYLLPLVVTGIPNGSVTFLWSDQLCENCESRSLVITDDITIGLVATDENGCMSDHEIRINVRINRSIFIPNIFSPNDDQLNDYFQIFSNALEEIKELSIYDRWGNLVFEKFNFQPNDPLSAWDGIFDGKAANPGVYAYKAIVIFKDGSYEVKHGDITLIR